MKPELDDRQRKENKHYGRYRIGRRCPRKISSKCSCKPTGFSISSHVASLAKAQWGWVKILLLKRQEFRVTRGTWSRSSCTYARLGRLICPAPFMLNLLSPASTAIDPVWCETNGNSGAFESAVGACTAWAIKKVAKVQEFKEHSINSKSAPALEERFFTVSIYRQATDGPMKDVPTVHRNMSVPHRRKHRVSTNRQ